MHSLLVIALGSQRIVIKFLVCGLVPGVLCMCHSVGLLLASQSVR